MSHRLLIGAIAAWISLALFGQGARTPDGQPDFQGVWAIATLTPLERPAEFAGREFLTETEAAEYERRTLQQVNTDRRDGGNEADLAEANYLSIRSQVRPGQQLIIPRAPTPLLAARADNPAPAAEPLVAASTTTAAWRATRRADPDGDDAGRREGLLW